MSATTFLPRFTHFKPVPRIRATCSGSDFSALSKPRLGCNGAGCLSTSLIAQLYKGEAQIKKDKLTGESKRAYRQQCSKLVVDKFFSWVNEQSQRIDFLPSDPFSKVLAYAKKREAGLRVFLDDPDVPLDTNHVERGIRGVAMGRRNWLFSWTWKWGGRYFYD